MSLIPKLYLAGPDVFRPESAELGALLQKACTLAGAQGLYPADDEVLAQIDAMFSAGASKEDVCEMIYLRDVEKLDACDGVVANLIPFRGPEADPGTTWEMGYARGLGKPVWAYCSDQRPYDQKVLAWNGRPFTQRNGLSWDRDGMMVDTLGQQANLMMTRSVVDKIIHADFTSALRAAVGYFTSRDHTRP
jgi:nucleoside 2-deoxyribosyltransferase